MAWSSSWSCPDMVLQTFRERGSQIVRSLSSPQLHICLPNFKQNFLLCWGRQGPESQNCVTLQESDKTGGLPARLCPWAVNHGKVDLAHKDAVHLEHECYRGDVSSTLFPSQVWEMGFGLGSMKPTGHLGDSKDSLMTATESRGRPPWLQSSLVTSYWLLGTCGWDLVLPLFISAEGTSWLPSPPLWAG